MINVGLKEYMTKDKAQQRTILLDTAGEIAHTLNLEYSAELFKSWIIL